MTATRQLEFSFYRGDILQGKSRFAASPGTAGVTMNSVSSVSAFPFTKLETTDADINKYMMTFGKGDILEISTSESEDAPLRTIFKGEFLKKKIHMDNATQTMTISSELVHSFYMLTYFEFVGKKSFRNTPIRDFLTEIIENSSCKSTLDISAEAEKIRINGITQKGSLFRIIKEMCYVNDLCLMFTQDNVVKVERKAEILARLRNQTPVPINADNVLSYEASESVPLMRQQLD